MSNVLWIIIGIVAVCLIALAIGLALYYAFRPDEASPSSDNPPSPDSSSPGTRPPPTRYPPPPSTGASPPASGVLIGTSTGPSTNKHLSVQCPTVQMDLSHLADCTDLTYNNIAGIVSGNCRSSSSSPMAPTQIDMAQCNTCNLTTRNGKLVCDIDYAGCPDTVYVPYLDIGGNDMVSYDGTADCVTHCDEEGCYWAGYNSHDQCTLKKTPDANNTSTGFALRNNSTTCPGYYVIPNTSVPNYTGPTYFDLTLDQCEQKCKDSDCDWYEYSAPIGKCAVKKGDYYNISNVQTMYPIFNMK